MPKFELFVGLIYGKGTARLISSRRNSRSSTRPWFQLSTSRANSTPAITSTNSIRNVVQA
jgi:hypothetical protein